MHVHALAWIVLAGIILTMIVVDIVGHVRTPHEPTLKEATWWSVAYIAIALIFGAIVWAVWGPQYGQEYLGGYITEKALSIDNLFVFVIILSTFRVPRKNQQEVLLAGIIIALVLRLIFILAGAALIENFSWVFYLFGAWLLWTAVFGALGALLALPLTLPVKSLLLDNDPRARWVGALISSNPDSVDTSDCEGSVVADDSGMGVATE